MPAIDTVPTETANWCWTVMGGLPVFNARQAYETNTHNNRSRASGGVCNDVAARLLTFRCYKKGDIETVKQRLDEGADVNAPIPSRKSSSEVVTAGVLTGVFLASTGGMGGGSFGGGRKTILPLHLAALNGQKKIAELLIAKGADVNAKDFNDLTLLHFAARKDHNEVAELLIANSADMNAKERRGRTPLHTAAYWGGKEVAAQLLAKGAEVNARDKSGATPLGGAIRRKHSEIADLLRKHGGKTKKELEAEGK